jgi:hypothetical protein
MITFEHLVSLIDTTVIDAEYQKACFDYALGVANGDSGIDHKMFCAAQLYNKDKADLFDGIFAEYGLDIAYFAPKASFLAWQKGEMNLDQLIYDTITRLCRLSLYRGKSWHCMTPSEQTDYLEICST